MLETERASPRYADIDAWPTADAVEAMLDGQLAAVAAVRAAVPAVAGAIDAAAERLGAHGRLLYIGAGTSGRIAVQDGAELAPTFNWPPERVVFAMAGGFEALTRSVEGAEDNVADGELQMTANKIARGDVAIGLAASGTTPFTVAALRKAGELGALTIGIANNASAPLLAAALHPVLIATGAEVVAGSTRMKAGTAQKIVLNMLSTGIMIRLGRVYRGRMVDMAARNVKLDKRAVAMVADLAGCTPERAQAALAEGEGMLKLAVLIAGGASRAEADRLLSQHAGNLRAALGARQDL